MGAKLDITRRLNFRIILPVIALVLFMGIGLNVLVLRFIDKFEVNSVTDDMEWASRFTQNIASSHFHDLLLSGEMNNMGYLRIHQGQALGDLEDFMRQKNFRATVFSGARGEVLLEGGFTREVMDEIERSSPENTLGKIRYQGATYYVYHYRFDPWDWHIILFKDVSDYAALLANVRGMYWATGILLLVAAGIFYFLLRRNINRPIRNIIDSISGDSPPAYRGILEFEYLSDSISRMMGSLKDREGFMTDVFDSIQDGISVLDTDMRIVRVNPTMEKWYSHNLPLVGKKCHVVYHGREEECEDCPSRETLDTGTTSFRIVPRIGPDGTSTGVLELYSFPMVEQETGLLKGVIEYVRDITERKQAEEKLSKSERRYRLLADNVTDIIWTMDMNLQWTYISPSVARMRGYSAEEMMARKLEDVVTPESYKYAMRILGEELALEGKPGTDPGRVQTLELEFLHKEGGTVWGEITASMLRDEKGEAIGILGVTRDVTDRKKAEQALKDSEERFRVSFQTSPDVLTITRTEDGIYLDVNDGFCSITGYTREEVVGKSSLDINIWDNPGDLERLVEGLQTDGKFDNLEAAFRMKDDSLIPGLLSARIIHVQGEPHLLTYTKPIADLKEAEERLRASLKEKDILLKEIHHRVKNNLQVISGLLNLQAHHIKGKKGREIYKESQNRVITMALIHEELFLANDLTQVDFAAYIKNMESKLFVSYGVKNENIDLVLETEHIEMVVDTAIPCGLIVNELISNSLKHAFPDNRKGEIRVDFKEVGDREFQLIVKDNGIGLPDGLDIHNTNSLGMQLVTVLADQLGATLEVVGEGGTEFRISFEEYHESGPVLY